MSGFALSGALAVGRVADVDPDTDAELGFFADAAARNDYVEQHDFKLMLAGGVVSHSGDETGNDLPDPHAGAAGFLTRGPMLVIRSPGR